MTGFCCSKKSCLSARFRAQTTPFGLPMLHCTAWKAGHVGATSITQVPRHEEKRSQREHGNCEVLPIWCCFLGQFLPAHCALCIARSTAHLDPTVCAGEPPQLGKIMLFFTFNFCFLRNRLYWQLWRKAKEAPCCCRSKNRLSGRMGRQ